MHSIEVVLAMLLAVVTSGYLVRAIPLSITLQLVQIALETEVSRKLVRQIDLMEARYRDPFSIEHDAEAQHTARECSGQIISDTSIGCFTANCIS